LEGGRYRPLSDDDVLKVHRAALRLLSEVGLADAPPSGVELLTRAGCTISDHGRLLFPASLIEDTLAIAARRFPLHAQDPRHDLEPWGKKVYFGTAGAAVHIVGADGRYRESTIRDLYDIGRVVDAMEHIHFFQRAVVPRDLPDPAEMDFNTCYAAVSSTTKHVGTSWVNPDHLRASLAMLHEIAGGEAKWRERPFVSQSNCFVVPPMKFAYDACKCLEVAVEGGMPVLLLSAGQAGATAPASLAGALAQEVAEVLAGLVYVNAIKPGHPAIFGAWCFVSDLRTGAMSGGSPEQALLSSMAGQMAHYYDLTGGTASGMTDSKIADAQSGAEKGLNQALVGNAGANLIYESAGMHASLLGFSFESLVIDNDIIGATQRTLKAVRIDDETLSFDTIRDVCLNGPGHFLGSDQTLRLMQTEYVYPVVGDRRSPNEWAEAGHLDALARAESKVREVLAHHWPAHVSEAVDDAMRAGGRVKLPREHMRPGAPSAAL
jgi:trimethylamine--corrinoid protein Co-methyltransferase